MSMLLLLLVLFGTIAYRTLGVDLYPKVEFPMVTIVSTLPSADPETLESTVTDPIEEALSTIDSINKVRSTSAEGISHIIIEFNLKKEIDIAYQEVQAKIGSIRSSLPRDLIGPVIGKFNIDEAPILTLIASADLPIGQLTHFVEKEIKEPLKRVPHVGQINVVGSQEAKVWLWVDRDLLKSHELTIHDVEMALKAQHIDLPAGRITKETSELIVKTKGQLQEATDFNDIVIVNRGNAPIRFSDIGRVEEGLEEERSFASLDGKSAIALMVGKQAGSNTVDVAKKVKKKVAQLQTTLGTQNIQLVVAKDDSVHIEHSVEDVRFHLFFGGGLAILIVFLFLRNLRSTFICGLALPTAVIGTFAFMAYLGFTQNVMTLLALSLAIGLLIDDAIVVQENIIRHMELGKSPMEAASAGTKEITLAVFATTLSVVAVFVPVAFMQGIVGRFFYQFGMTVSIAVLISMLVSFTLNPLFSSRFLTPPKRGRIYQLFESAFQALENGYARLLRLCLKNKKIVLSVAILSFVGAIYLASALKFEFSPKVDRSEFTVSIKTAEDASLSQTMLSIEEAQNHIEKHPWVKYLYTTVGSGHFNTVNQGSIYVKMFPKEKRSTTQREAMARIRDELSSLSNATITVSEVEKGPRGHGGDLQLEIRGPSLETLKTLSEKIIAKMEASTGYVDIDTSLKIGKPQIEVSINRAAAADMGVSPFQIAGTLQTAFGGSLITTLQKAGKRRDVTIRFSETFRNDPTQIPLLNVRNQRGELIPLSPLIEMHTETSHTQIDRMNRVRQLSISANLIRSQKVLGDAVKEISTIIEQEGLPAGYHFAFGGEAEMMKESFTNMLFALILAIVLVYMVLAAQFESFSHPFIIMLSLPLSVIGAIGALVTFDMTMSIFTMIGIIMLMGLVTKNGILLVDFINTLYLKEKMERNAAIIKAGKHRLRPILMTTCAVVLGMLPIALSKGSGSEANAPMAVAVIGGLITSTLLTLIVVPVVYALFETIREKKLLSLIMLRRAKPQKNM